MGGAFSPHMPHCWLGTPIQEVSCHFEWCIRECTWDDYNVIKGRQICTVKNDTFPWLMSLLQNIIPVCGVFIHEIFLISMIMFRQMLFTVCDSGVTNYWTEVDWTHKSVRNKTIAFFPRPIWTGLGRSLWTTKDLIMVLGLWDAV